MNDEKIRQIVELVLNRLEDASGKSWEAPAPALDDSVCDIADTDIRQQYLVDRPHDREAFMALKEKTPARIGVGHTGARYKTATMLRFAADHAQAQASVFTDVEDAFLAEMGWPKFTAACTARDEFLTRPDLGRTFSDTTIAEIKRYVGDACRVLLYVADGLSSSAVLANAADILPVLQKGLSGYGVSVNKPFFVQYGRVAAMDVLGEALGPEVVCVLIGERPGLVTADSMSAYIAYKPTVGMPESRRTVLANIHKGGTPPVEAGAYLVDLIREMLEKRASGVDLSI